ncbi:hypothetical protein ACFQAT_29010 [Undibacterium arcticum]|uniref:hypothetical protein n=1 Tax=Undibacterium arcticum TaxID=1762892 RepID=UPI003619F736
MRILNTIALGLLLSISVAACSTFGKVDQRQGAINKSQEDTARQVDALRKAQTKPVRETVRYVDEQWVSLRPMVVKEKVNVPELNCKLNLQTSEAVSIFEFSQIVTKYCNISVRVTPDAIAQIENPTSVAQAANAMTQAPVVPNVLAFPQAGAASRPGAQNANLIDINYKGNLTGLLEIVTARFGILWKFEEGKSRFTTLIQKRISSRPSLVVPT